MKFYKHLQKLGKRTPLDERPFVDSVSEWYVSQFSMLSGSRSIGMSSGHIPLSEIIAYVQFFPLLGTVHEFIYVIQNLDSKFLQYQEAEKLKAQKRSASKRPQIG